MTDLVAADSFSLRTDCETGEVKKKYANVTRNNYQKPAEIFQDDVILVLDTGQSKKLSGLPLWWYRESHVIEPHSGTVDSATGGKVCRGEFMPGSRGDKRLRGVKLHATAEGIKKEGEKSECRSKDNTSCYRWHVWIAKVRTASSCLPWNVGLRFEQREVHCSEDYPCHGPGNETIEIVVQPEELTNPGCDAMDHGSGSGSFPVISEK